MTAPALAVALLGAALAAEAPSQSGDYVGFRALLDATTRLEAAEDADAARDVLRYALYRYPEARPELRRRLHALPAGWSVWGPRSRLMTWQAGLWAAALGPGVSYYLDEWDWSVQSRVGWGGGIAGGLAGIGVGAWYSWAWDPTHAQVTGIVGAQQLLGFHGGVVGVLTSDRWSEDAWRGYQVGLVLGVGAGYALARLPLDEGEMTAAAWGALWGLGLGAAVKTMRYSWDGEARQDWPTLLAFVDGGVVGAWALAHTLGAARQDVHMANLGGLVGFGMMWMVGLMTVDSIMWTEASAATSLTVATVVGGVAGVAVGRGVEGLIPEHPPWRRGAVALRAPIPIAVPTAEGLRVEVSVVRGSF